MSQILKIELSRGEAEPLQKLMQHPSPKVRARAALALGRIGAKGPEAIDHLLQAVGDPEALVRRRAVFALGLEQLSAEQREVVSNKILTLFRQGEKREVLALGYRALGSIVPLDGGKLSSQVATLLTEPVQRDLIPRLEALELLGRRGLRLSQQSWLRIYKLVAPLMKGKPGAARQQCSRALLQLRAGSQPRFRSLLLAEGERAPTPALVRSLKRPASYELQWLVRRYRDFRVPVQLAAAEMLLRAKEGAGADLLARELHRTWRSVSSNHFRLTGEELHPVLQALSGLGKYAGRPEVRKLSRELLELTDVRDSTVSYSPKEAYAVDLVHCAAARLVDLAQGSVEQTRTCGTAKAPWLTPKVRAAFVPGSASQPQVSRAAQPQQGWVLPAQPLPRRGKLVTPRGLVRFELWPERAPAAVAQLDRLARTKSWSTLRVLAGERVDLPLMAKRFPAVMGSPSEQVLLPGTLYFLPDHRTLAFSLRQQLDSWAVTAIGRITEGMDLLKASQSGDPVKGLFLESPKERTSSASRQGQSR